MNESYEEKRRMLLRKKTPLTAEEKFFAGIDKYEAQLKRLSDTERGEIQNFRDLMDIEENLRTLRVSVVEVMKSYNIPTRDALYKALGREPMIFAATSIPVAQERKKRHFAPKKADIERIVTEYENETPTHILALSYQTSQDAIRRILRKAGVKLRKTHKRLPRLRGSEEMAIEKQFLRGATAKEIAEALSLDKDQVARHVRRVYGKKI